jgi:manganese/zinc/iron transport system permease protein
VDVGSLFADLLFDYTLRTVALGSATLGVVSGVLGAFAVLRRQSLLGDAVAHAALPGIALVFLLTGSKSPWALLAGAIAAGWVGTLAVQAITRATRVKEDAALGIVLSVFFGFGVVLLTFIQKLPTASQAGLDAFLFGQAATLVTRDVVAMVALGGVALVAVALLWKEMKLITFDPAFAASLGLPTARLSVLLITLIVVAIVVGLQTVGVVLMSAMIVAPAAAARQWTDRLGPMVALSGVLGAAAGLAGAVTSSLVPRLPTGPTIVLYISAVVLVSLLFAPGRGILARYRRMRRQQLRFAADALLVHLLHHEGRPDEATESAVAHLTDEMGWDGRFAGRVLRWARQREMVEQTDGALRLTPGGRAAARAAMAR